MGIGKQILYLAVYYAGRRSHGMPILNLLSRTNVLYDGYTYSRIKLNQAYLVLKPRGSSYGKSTQKKMERK